MADVALSAATTGVALAALTAELFRHDGDCEGLLWGTQVHSTANVAPSDSHEDGVSSDTAHTSCVFIFCFRFVLLPFFLALFV